MERRVDTSDSVRLYPSLSFQLPVDSSSFSLWTLWTIRGNGVRCERSINKYKKQQTCSICLSVNRSPPLCFITLHGIVPTHTHTKSTGLT